MQGKTLQQQSSQDKDRIVQTQPGLAGQRISGPKGIPGSLLSLQRSHGNRFVQRLLDNTVLQRACGCGGTCSACGQAAQAEDPDRPALQRKSSALSSFIQAKLTVSQPGDQYEQEADRVADQVLRKVAATGPTLSTQDGESSVQRAEDSSTSDENTTGNPLIDQINVVLEQEGLQAKAESGSLDVSDDFESELLGANGAGQPIPGSAKTEMENAFGADFSSVRLHTDSHAVAMSRNVNAHAFTHGNDIYFNEGKFDPSSREGKHLLAHELTHTIQQGGDQIRRLTITRPLRNPGSCGGRQVRWIFTLDNPAPADGYIVQRVKYLLTDQNCPSNVSSISLQPTMDFWEAWQVNAGATREALHSRFGYTDQSYRAPEPTKSGVQATLGTVKFFLRSVTGDLGRDGVPPASPGSSWGPGNAPASQSLPSTLTQPSWWNDTPTEGPARRWASSWWNCCGDASSNFSRIDSNP